METKNARTTDDELLRSNPNGLLSATFNEGSTTKRGINSKNMLLLREMANRKFDLRCVHH